MATNDGPISGSTSLRSPEPVPVSALTGNDPGQGLKDEELFAELQDVEAKVTALQRNLWPDDYAGGSTVNELAEQIRRLCRIIGEIA